MKELEDYHWFPERFRNYQTEFIGFVVAKFSIYQPFIHYLKLLDLKPKALVDLCSGSGEPAISIFKKSNVFVSLELTDKYPNSSAQFPSQIKYHQNPIDAMDMTFQADKHYSMFNAFHHFSDAEKLEIAKSISHADAEAFIVEILEPSFFSLIKVLFATTIGSLLISPFIQPFSLRRLFFTYVLPINIFTISYDGIVSVLKSRSLCDYKKLLSPLGDGVEIIRLKSGISPLLLIHIKPKK